jgi:hypothetical protein
MTRPALTALRRVDVFEQETMIALRKTRARIEHVAIRAITRRLRDAVPIHDILDACVRHPVRSLGFELGAIDLVLAHPVFAQLEAITVGGRLASAIPLVHQLRDSLAITVAPSPSLPPCIAGPLITLGSAQLVRTGTQVTLRGWGQWFVDSLAETNQQCVVTERFDLGLGNAHVVTVMRHSASPIGPMQWPETRYLQATYSWA